MEKGTCNTEIQYKEQGQLLLSFIRARVPQEEEAKDIWQETFVRFEECCQKARTCDHPKSYLYKMALNAVADHYRRKKKERMAFHQVEQQAKEGPEEQEAFPCDIYACVDQFLAKLSPENQEAFIKSDIEQIPQIEIAEELNLPISTLKSRVQRTRTYLKREFELCLKNG